MRSFGSNFKPFYFLFFWKDFTHKKSRKRQTSDFHSDSFIRLKNIKSKQATFTHKKHKMQTSFVLDAKKGQRNKQLSFSQMLLKSTKSEQVNKRLSSQTFFKRMFAYELFSSYFCLFVYVRFCVKSLHKKKIKRLEITL